MTDKIRWRIVSRSYTNYNESDVTNSTKLVVTNFISRPILVDVAHIATNSNENSSTPTKLVSIGCSVRSA